ncbi:MAG: carboxylating nicotinate-nucleotide diphosphorylase [Candidatus Latescibacterota bacterium]|nr:MAG: carboxylating nicotinate-nucleotide diphosphorylase [Candidatus Latescibacterota bacterium]
MLDPHDLDAVVAAALAEDVGAGDATTLATVPRERTTEARIVARDSGVVAGRPVLERVFLHLDPTCAIDGMDDGDAVDAEAVVWRLRGSARALLTGERVALNFVQRLCGIATLTARFVGAVAGTGAAITDTRKTTPTLRFLEKYAVRCGGGANHRQSLDAMLLVKENHIAMAGSLRAAVRAALAAARGREVEVEVRHVEELRVALELGVDRVLLDHWTPAAVRDAVRLRGDRAKPQLEVSGNLTLDNVRQHAVPGVQYLSVGALTHSAPAFDLSMLVEGAF